MVVIAFHFGGLVSWRQRPRVALHGSRIMAAAAWRRNDWRARRLEALRSGIV